MSKWAGLPKKGAKRISPKDVRIERYGQRWTASWHIEDGDLVVWSAWGSGKIEFPEGSIEGTASGFVAPVVVIVDKSAEIELSWRIVGGRWSKPIIWHIFVPDSAVRLPDDLGRALRDSFKRQMSVQRSIARTSENPPTNSETQTSTTTTPAV